MANKLFGIADPYYDALRVQSNQAIWPDAGGSSSGIGGLLENKIYLWPADGSTIATFEPIEAGLIAVLAAAASGDTVWLPSMTIALTAAITIPAGVILRGISRNAKLSFGTLGGIPAFPATSILDNFNRADEGPPPSSNWKPWTGNVDVTGNDLRVKDNTLQLRAGDNGWTDDFWDNSTFGPDCEVYCTIDNCSGANAGLEFWARLSKTVDPFPDLTGYKLRVTVSSGWFLYRLNSWSSNTILASAGDNLTTSEKIGLSLIGSAITVHKRVGGVWSVVTSVTDGTFGSAGYIGVGLHQGSSIALDDFGGGTVVPVSAPAITLGADASLERVIITQTANDTNDLVTVQGPASGTAYLSHAIINCAQSGAGDAIALDGTAGAVEAYDSYLNGDSDSGTGYGVRSGAGAITLDDCWVIGNTAPLNIGAGGIITSGTRMGTVSGEPAQGDRSAWDTATYFNRHASDINAATFTYHNNPAIAPATAFVSTAINLTLNNTHHHVKVTAVATITLPTAVGISGQEYIIKATVDGVLVNTTSSQTIDGDLTKTLLANDCIVVFSDNANWLIG